GLGLGLGLGLGIWSGRHGRLPVLHRWTYNLAHPVLCLQSFASLPVAVPWPLSSPTGLPLS
ncbi:MAG TPA: hypothetical protein VMF89_17225, partial [Polyangiales bacterium]|nr:hypothetical protein [Polyangiales bacterium]